MANTVLQVCIDAADALSLARPVAVVGSTDDNSAQKLVRHLAVTLRQLATRRDWANLIREYTFPTAAGIETYSLPDDFLRFVPESLWNRTRKFRFQQALSADEWQAYKASLTTMAFQAYRLRGAATATPQLLIAPIPAAVEVIAFEYISSAIGLNGATPVTAFTADTNTLLLDQELATLGVIWRYRKAEGRDYGEDFREFEMRYADLVKRDGGMRRLDMGPTNIERVPLPPRVPETLIFS